MSLLSGSRLATTLVLLLTTYLLLACTAAPPLEVAQTPSESLQKLPVGRPVDIVKRTSAPWVYGTSIADGVLAFVETPYYGLGQPEMDGAGGPTRVRLLDLANLKADPLVGPTLREPRLQNGSFFPWWLVKLLPSGDPSLAPLIFTASGEGGMTASARRRYGDARFGRLGDDVSPLLDPQIPLLEAERVGDVLVLTEALAGQDTGASRGGGVLLLTGRLPAAHKIDPLSPRLPADALVGLSPYLAKTGLATVLNAEPQGSPPALVTDLRTGKEVRFRLPAGSRSGQIESVAVSGARLAWTSTHVEAPDLLTNSARNEVYVADLLTGRVELLHTRRTGISPGDMSPLVMNEKWLARLESQGEKGWKLFALSLADGRALEVEGVLGPHERLGDLALGGDVAFLNVIRERPGGRPHSVSVPPEMTAIRAVRLG